MGSPCDVFHTLQHILKLICQLSWMLPQHHSLPQMHQIQTSEGEVECGTVMVVAAQCPAQVTTVSLHVELRGEVGDLVM